jgi:hypothetical protein
MCADELTNMGCEHKSSLMIYKHCPAFVVSLIIVDVSEVTTPIFIVKLVPKKFERKIID